jgi:hypothetical protein
MGTQDPAVTSPEISLPPPDRRCGRCQRPFAGDPNLFFQTDWALCTECEQILLSHQPSRDSTTAT